ncbi:hypothetical protein P8815_13805 [Bacillus altitudinis]|uniref:hypothetical protein n=1 Tax=Bacillus TaxID=1386 RepID=UPI000260A8EA|nr:MULTISPECIES: hypothetical protein [Bacillus]EIL85369.1 hypothetical protein BAME_13920 [Bacillus sp. M 2-6]MEC0472810.1 hypothetical protein [Bacillus altitudinis]NQW95333.1 hypothetical protein [Bacillus stratosphericus]
MWVKNKVTGLVWNVTEEHYKYLIKQSDYEKHNEKKTKKAKTKAEENETVGKDNESA